MEAKDNISRQSDEAEKLLAIVIDLVKQVQRDSIVSFLPTLDSSLDRDLGFDSLTRVELMSRIEKSFNITISDQTLAIAETPRDFLRTLHAQDRSQKSPSAHPTEMPLSADDEIIPEHAETLIEVLHYHAINHSDRIHIRLYSDKNEGEVITYGELWREAQQRATALQEHGLEIGETVLIMLPTCRDYFISFFSILLAGGIPVPMYPPGRIKQIEEHLSRHTAIAANSLAKFMITIAEAKRFAQLMHHHVPTLSKIFTPDDLSSISSSTVEYRVPKIESNSTAFLQYTSGSTGAPKGVVLSHANLLTNIRTMGDVLQVTGNDVFVSWLPLYHDMGLIGAWLGSLYYGCPLISLSPLSFIAKPLRWLNAISQFKGTLSAAPNFAYELCLRRISDEELQKIDLHSWRCAFNGAETVSPTTLKRFISRFSQCGFQAETMMPVYGLAESSVGLAFPLKRRPPLIDKVKRHALTDTNTAEPTIDSSHSLEFVSCGNPLPGHQIRVVDETQRELPDRFQGYIQFCGPSSTSGYFRNPEATAQLFQEKWLNSGDLGYIADGEIYITGRSKDLVIKAGRNIYPTELEEAIAAVEGVISGNIAVFGSRDSESGTERLIVLAETRKKKPEALEALRVAVNTVVTDICDSPPDEVVLAPPNTVLKTSSGKIRRNACRDLYENGEIGKAKPAIWLQLTRLILSGFVPQLKRFSRWIQTWLYAFYAWMLFGLATPVVWLLVVVLPLQSWRWGVIRSSVKAILRLTNIAVRVEGLENLPKHGFPCIFVSNHASYLDSIILASVLPSDVSFIAKAEFKKNFYIRLPLTRLNTLFVERFARDDTEMEGLRTKAFATSKGRSLFFFAEGTLTRMPGLLPFRLGAFRTALDTNLPIIPIAIRGTRLILRGDSWYPRHGRVRITIGNPIKTQEREKLTDENQWQAVVGLRDQIRGWILQHCGEPDLQHERPEIFTTSHD